MELRNVLLLNEISINDFLWVLKIYFQSFHFIYIKLTKKFLKIREVNLVNSHLFENMCPRLKEFI